MLDENVRLGQTQFHLLYSKLPILIYAADHDSRLVGVNDRWLEALHYTRAEVLGHPVSDFLTAAARERLVTHYLPALRSNGRINAVPCDLLNKESAVLPALLTAVAEPNETQDWGRLLAVLTQPEEHRLAQAAIDALAPTMAIRTEADSLVTLVSDLAGVFHARYAFVTECANRAMTRVRTLAFVDNNELLENIEYDLAGTPCEGVIHGSGCYYPDRLGALFQSEPGKDSYLGVPLYDSHGAIMGHLAVLDDHPMQVESQALAMLEIFAARAAAELERKHAAEAMRASAPGLDQINQQLQAYNRDLAQLVADRTQEIERRRQVAESLRDLLLILNSNQPLEEILNHIVNSATALLGTESGAIYGLQPDQSTPFMQAARGLPVTHASDLSFALEQDYIHQAVVKRQPVVVSNLASLGAAADNDGNANKQTLLAEYFRTLLMVPLIRSGLAGMPDEVFGGIALYFRQPRQFSDEEISLAVAYGAQAALAIENARLRQLSEQAAIMAERNRLARDLHDSVTQSLYSLTLLAEGWRRMAAAGTLPALEPAFAELGDLGRQALKEMRLLLYELRPPALEKVGLLGAIHQRLAAVEKRAGMDARLIADAVVDLPPALETGLYHITQEALNNILKHAEADSVVVSLNVHGEHLCLEVTDNGRGFEPALGAAASGIGLASMHERAAQIGGVLTIDSAPNLGCKVCVMVPLLMARRATIQP